MVILISTYFCYNTRMTKRVFFAINLPVKIKENLAKVGESLAKNLGFTLLNLGMEIDSRPWRSHVTLGRVKDEEGVCDLDIDVALQEFEVKNFELMESQPDQDGSVYKTLASYPLSH